MWSCSLSRPHKRLKERMRLQRVECVLQLRRFSAFIVRVGTNTVGWMVWVPSCLFWNDERIKLANGPGNYRNLIDRIDLNSLVQYAIQKVCLFRTDTFNQRIETLSSPRISSVLLIRHAC